MSLDYYSPHPRLHLARPLVIAGDLGGGSRLIGRTVCARTGLPFVEVDRQIEHEAGESLSALADRIGTKRLAERARTVLERVARERPWAVVALEWAWPNHEATHLFRRKLSMVYVQRPGAFLLERVEKEVHRAGPWVLDGSPCVFRDEGDLASLHQARRDLLGHASVLLSAGDLHAHRVSDLILDELDSMLEGERI